MKKRRLVPPSAAAIGVHPASTVLRFWDKVDRRSPDECWPWTGSVGQGGYGRMKVGDRIVNANRLAWEIENGTDLGDQMACHTCDNRRCVNPGHLYAGSHESNMHDAKRRSGLGAKKPETGKLTAVQVNSIRERSAWGETQAALARDYGVTPRAIRCILKGETWVGKGDAPRA